MVIMSVNIAQSMKKRRYSSCSSLSNFKNSLKSWGS